MHKRNCTFLSNALASEEPNATFLERTVQGIFVVVLQLIVSLFRSHATLMDPFLFSSAL